MKKILDKIINWFWCDIKDYSVVNGKAIFWEKK